MGGGRNAKSEKKRRKWGDKQMNVSNAKHNLQSAPGGREECAVGVKKGYH
jgi:hypothetical protein